MKKVKKAVVLAAGYGTRFMPFSKAVSKTMLPIIDTPTIQLILEEAFESGVKEALVVVGYNKESIISHFSKNLHLEEKLKDKPEFLKLIKKPANMKVKFIEQKELNGTAGAIMLAKDFTKDEPFLLMYADDLMYCEKPVSKQIIEEYEKTGKCVLACQNVPKELVVKYSSVEYLSKNSDRSYNVSKIIEKPKFEDIKSTLSTLGRYILLPYIYEYAEKIQPSINGERFVTDAFDMIAKDKGCIAYDFEGIRYDIGNKFGYLTAVVDYALRDKSYSKQFKEFLKKKLK